MAPGLIGEDMANFRVEDLEDDVRQVRSNIEQLTADLRAERVKLKKLNPALKALQHAASGKAPGVREHTSKALKTEQESAILSALSAGALTAAALQSSLGVSNTRITYLLTGLRKAGKVVKVGDLRNARYILNVS